MCSINILTYPTPMFRLYFYGPGPVFALRCVGLYIKTEDDDDVSVYPIYDSGEIDFDDDISGGDTYIVDRLVKNTYTYNRFLEAWLKENEDDNLGEKDFLLEMKEQGLPVYE